jgi:hypothetical protein
MSLSEAEPVWGWGNLSRWTLAAVRVALDPCFAPKVGQIVSNRLKSSELEEIHCRSFPPQKIFCKTSNGIVFTFYSMLMMFPSKNKLFLSWGNSSGWILAPAKVTAYPGFAWFRRFSDDFSGFEHFWSGPFGRRWDPSRMVCSTLHRFSVTLKYHKHQIATN